MSIQFSNTTTKAGIIQNIESSCNFEDGDISGNSVLMAKFTGKVNLALDDVMALALKNAGWIIHDDFNHTGDPFITIDLVSGQRDYHFTRDSESSLILGYYKVMVMDAGGIYREIEQSDFSRNTPSTFIDGQNTQGTPTKFLKAGNGLFLDFIPSYSQTAGIKLFIDRETTYFTVSDTTKVAGIDGLCQDYLYLKPSYEYARDKGLQNKESLFRDLQISKQKTESRYGTKDKVSNRRMIPAYQNNK